MTSGRRGMELSNYRRRATDISRARLLLLSLLPRVRIAAWYLGRVAHPRRKRIRAGRGNCKITGSAATREIGRASHTLGNSGRFPLGVSPRRGYTLPPPPPHIINVRPDLTATDNFLDNYGGGGGGTSLFKRGTKGKNGWGFRYRRRVNRDEKPGDDEINFIEAEISVVSRPRKKRLPENWGRGRMVTKMEWKIASRNVSISVYNPLSRQIVNYYNVLNVSFERQGGGAGGGADSRWFYTWRI